MYGAQSEYLPLKKVIMHRPSDEVNLVTEGNVREFLYRDVVSKEKMQKEHDSYTQFLEENGVEVIFAESSLFPNLLFTRDAASVTKEGALLMRPRFAARASEPLVLKKTFERLHIPVRETRGYAEGGDLVYVNEDVLMVGYGPRTDFGGVLSIRECVHVKEVIAVPLPSFRVHLDGALMVLGKDLAIFHPGSLLFPGRVLDEDEVVSIPQFLRERGFELIEVSDGEVKSFGPNILVVNPSLVVSYWCNERIIKTLEEYSFEVFSLRGEELMKAGGGPHCMTCPVLRE